MAHQSVTERDAATESAPAPRSTTLRAFLIALVVTVFVMAWVEYSELITPTSQMSESTPPIPAILGLGFVWGAVALWRWFTGALERVPGVSWLGRIGQNLALTRHEILAVYLFLIVSCAMPSVGVVRLILPCLMGLQYFGEPSNHYQEMSREIPPSWAPVNPEDVRTFWEGSDKPVPTSGMAHVPVVGPVIDGVYQFFSATAVVPWQAWKIPYILWSFYLIVYFFSSFCIVNLFRRRWAEDERLTFPLATMSIDLVSSGNVPGTDRPFFKDPIVWVGFSLAVLYNAGNMLHAFNPSVPCLGLFYPIGQIFTEEPWREMNGLAIWYKPEIMGLGYLVPSQILFSIFFFSLMQWFARPAARVVGMETPGFPFSQIQATGAMIALGVYYIFQARGRLKQIVRKAITGDPSVDDSNEPFSYRISLLGAVVGLVILVWMPAAYGVELWQIGIYMLVGTLFLIAYARIRAEIGLPIVWGYPLLQQKEVLSNFFGSKALISQTNLHSFTLLNVLTFFERGTYYAITSTEQESCAVGDTMGLGSRRTARWLMLAVVVGFVATMWMYLTAYYTWGGNVMETVGGTEGGQRVQIAMSQFHEASQWISQPQGPNVTNINATVFGAVMVILMIIGQRTLVRFPFHPIGYALACCHENYMWFVALVQLTVRFTVTRIGGHRLYRRLTSGFIAFTLGHYCSIGVWSLIGLYAGENVQRYRVWFL